MIPAVAYYRMSTDRQETSIPDQRIEVEKMATQRGYDVIRDYIDEGISGDATDKRKGFQEMRLHAERKGDFEAILCWDQDRFGRFDSLEAGFWIKPIRDAGVRLVTVAQGEIDWNDFAGRMIYGMQQEGKHQFLCDISRNLSRHQLQSAKAGSIPSGSIPYGFARIYRDSTGNLLATVPRGSAITLRPKNCKISHIAGDPMEVDTVRWLFRTYLEKDVGALWLRDHLNEQGIPSPNGALWTTSSIYAVLTNQSYTGDLVFGRVASGKYHTVMPDAVRRADKRSRGRKPSDQWIITPGVHEPLISHEEFDSVKQKLESNRGRTGRMAKQGAKYHFTGLIYCDHCGIRMCGYGGKKRVPRYICQNYLRFGRACGCRAWGVDEEQLTIFVVDLLNRIVFNDGNYEHLRQRIEEQILAAKDDSTSQLAASRIRVKELRQKIERGAQRLLASDDDLVDVLRPQLRAWQTELQRLESQISKADRRAKNRTMKDQVDDALAMARGLRDALDDTTADRFREVIRRLIHQIRLRFRPMKSGESDGRGWTVVDSAEIVLGTDARLLLEKKIF